MWQVLQQISNSEDLALEQRKTWYMTTEGDKHK